MEHLRVRYMLLSGDKRDAVENYARMPRTHACCSEQVHQLAQNQIRRSSSLQGRCMANIPADVLGAGVAGRWTSLVEADYDAPTPG